MRIGNRSARTRNHTLFYLSENKMRHLNSFFALIFLSFCPLFRRLCPIWSSNRPFRCRSRQPVCFTWNIWKKHRDLSPRGAAFYPMRYKHPFSDLPTPLSIETPLFPPTQPLTPYILCAFSWCSAPFHAFLMCFCLLSPVFKCFSLHFLFLEHCFTWNNARGRCFCYVRLSRSADRGSQTSCPSHLLKTRIFVAQKVFIAIDVCFTWNI